jgi:hypothetical protein
MSGKLLDQRGAVVAPKQPRSYSETNSEGEESSHTNLVEAITPGAAQMVSRLRYRPDDPYYRLSDRD